MSMRSSFVLVALLCVLSPCVSADIFNESNNTLAQQRLYLEALYNSSSGFSWEYDTHWNSNKSICEWYGVVCNQDGSHVIALELAENSLSGTLAPNIALLGPIERLNFSRNELLWGDLPEDLGSLFNLKVLDLARCSKLRNAPPSIGDLANLEVLLINSSSAIVLPRQIENLSNLRYLDLTSSRTDFATWGVNWAKMTSLEVLILDSVNLPYLPTSLAYAPSLQRLDLRYSEVEHTKHRKDGHKDDDKDGDNSDSGTFEWHELGDTLVYLDIAATSLSPLPPGLRNLTNLQHLDISGMIFSDINEDLFRPLTKLKFLGMSWMTWKPWQMRVLSVLPHIESLDISHSKMKTVPKELPLGLKNLKRLVMDNNQLQEVPNELALLTELETLSLRSNSIKQFPENFWTSLTNLKTVVLAENKNITLNEDFGNLISLESLDFSFAYQNVPESVWSNFQKLKILNVVEWHQPSPPDSWRYLISLEHLHASAAFDTFPGSILGSLTNLITAEFSFSRHMSIPVELTKLTQLRKLVIAMSRYEAVSEPFPQFIGELKNLEWFDCSLRLFSGPFPKPLCQLPKLKHLLMPGNSFTGSVPEECGKLKQLKFVSLNNNFLTGPLPIFDPDVRLRILLLESNRFTGSIPDSYGNLRGIHHLSLQGNDLRGSIPRSILNLNQLVSLNLARNRLSGPLPGSFKFQSSNGVDRQINLSHNMLSGEIPADFFIKSSSENLVWKVDLQKNRFTGELPREVTVSLILFDVSYNQLSGTVPDVYFSSKIATHLGLANNRFTGELTADMSLMKELLWLRLDYNAFTGSLPVSVAGCPRIFQLSLSHNNLTGPVPKEYNNLKSLTMIDLSFNELEGELPIPMLFGKPIKTVNFEHNRFTTCDVGKWMGRTNPSLVLLNYAHNQVSRMNLIELVTSFPSMTQLFAQGNNQQSDHRLTTSPLRCSLVTVDLSQNRLQALYWLQELLTSCPGLSTVSFAHNHATGELEFGEGRLEHLQRFAILSIDLSFNQLEGRLPRLLFPSLRQFILDSNQLTGEIPESYSQLFYFTARDNPLRSRTGNLPVFLRTSKPWTRYDEDTFECPSYVKNQTDSVVVFRFDHVYDDRKSCRCLTGYAGRNGNCTRCPSNQYSDRAGLTSCRSCPPHSFTTVENASSIQDCICEAGYYWMDRACVPCEPGYMKLQAGRQPCDKCPETGVTCLGNSFAFVPGFWTETNNISSATIFHKCRSENICQVEQTTTLESHIQRSFQCANGHTGSLCNACEDGYAAYSNHCYQCWSSRTVTILCILGSVIGILIAGVYIVRRSIQSISKSSDIIVRIVVNSLQFSAIAFQFQDESPTSSSETATWLETFGGVYVGGFLIQCVTRLSFEQIYAANIALPAIIVIVSIVTLHIIQRLLTRRGRIQDAAAIRSSTVPAVVFVLFFCYSRIVLQIFSVFDCYDRDIYGQRWLTADLTHPCPTSFEPLFIVNIVMLCLYVIGIPAAGAVVLYRYRNQLHDHDVKQQYGFLYSGYLPQFCWWEISVILFRKVLTVLIGTLLKDEFQKNCVLTFLTVLALFVHVNCLPFEREIFNKLEAAALTTTLVQQLGTIMYSELLLRKAPNMSTWTIVLSILMIAAMAGFLLVAVLLYFKVSWLDHVTALKRVKERLSSICGSRKSSAANNDSDDNNKNDRPINNQQGRRHNRNKKLDDEDEDEVEEEEMDSAALRKIRTDSEDDSTQKTPLLLRHR